MTKPSFGTHPYLLGFDRIERLAERAAKSADGYPPYNIEARGVEGGADGSGQPQAFRITLAVAGFAESQLSVTMEDRQLVIRGRPADEDEAAEAERVFLHRGIGGRAFQRSFVLAEGVEVTAARLENGLLHIDLRRRVPDQIIQTIPISR